MARTKDSRGADETVKQRREQELSSESSSEKDGSDSLADKNGFKTIYLEGSSIPVIVRPHHPITKALLQTKVKPVPSQRPSCPKSYKNPLDLITWGWIAPLLHTGFNRILEINDIFEISEAESNERRMQDYLKKLDQYQARNKDMHYAEMWAALYAIRWPFAQAIISSALYAAAEIGLSLMSRTLITLVDDIYTGETKSHGHASAFAVGSTLVQLGFQFFFVWNGYRTRALAETVRTILITAIYNKITKLSPAGRQMFPPSKITSVITTDTNRIFMAARWSSILIIFIFAFGGMLGVLIKYLGVAALPGAGLVLLGIVVNVFVSRFITGLRRKSLPFADARIGSIRETMENMRVIKFYGWESSFVKLVAKARLSETNYLKKLGAIEGAIDATLTSIPPFGGVLSFAVRIILGKTLSATVAFPSLTLFQLFVPLSMMFSQAITSHADAWASVKRIDALFRAPEDPSYVITDEISPGAIRIVDGAFKWDFEPPTLASKTRWRRKILFYKRQMRIEDEQTVPPGGMDLRSTASARDDFEDDKAKFEEEQDRENASEGITRAGAKKFPGLRNINISLKPKELIMIVGSIGSGKTTLLNSILGLVSKTQGSVFVGGDVVNVMSMWSQNATIRKNILFGKEYDEERYNETVRVCSLQSDFDSFAGGDFAEVGERGITLSGGQKARIALARCVYAGGDIVLLDDVLSAVDGKVSNHIFKHCIKEKLKDCTRLLVTHNLKLLNEADRIVYMDGNGHAHIDTLTALLESEPHFKKMYLEATNRDSSEDSESDGLAAVRQSAFEAEMQQRRTQAEDFEEDGEEVLDDVESGKDISKINERALLASTKLIQDEQRSKGTVSGTVLYRFLSSGAKIGIFFIPIVILPQLAVATAQAMQSVFLQFWTENRYHHPNGVYIGYYCLILASRAICFICVAVCTCVFCFNSSSSLHNRAVENIYRAPMSYFDSTPLGRIINRFTDDIANLDTQMFMELRMTLMSSSILLASIVTIFVYIPWAILALLPIILVAFVLLNYYRASARELKRINSLFRSSMFTLVTESISGMAVILSYKREKIFAKDLNKRIDDMNVSFQINLASQYWLSLRVAMATLSVTLIVLLLCVFQVFNLNSSKVGMLMSMLPNISISVVILLPMLTELENQMNSVERLYELGNTIPQEAAFHIPETMPPESWPQVGSIAYENASLRYREGLPNVLDNVSLIIKGGQKVGICGRTGAGKSTILASLFRLTELSGGRIVIDGIDVSTIGLRDLRTKLAIIPQEPVLFQGTIRSNLDPFGDHSDTELWSALRRAGVIRADEAGVNGQVSAKHRFHLDTKTNSEGSNFSLGECQLLTLARALVRNAKIIVLDEATATVDFETDRMIQQTISREFSHCTILCVAHRLQTIVNYDKVVIMEAGKILEEGTPKRLFDDKSSRFASMCAESGITEKNFMESQAESTAN
nr:Yor1.1 [Starmerella bombicola]